MADKLELTTEDESDNSHQRQTQKCFSCEEYSLLLPCHLTEDDRVLISHEEILVFPSDYSNNNDWVQTAIINRNRDKVFYSRTDAAKLEKFLLQEQNAMQQAVQKKCNFHSTQCDTCDLLSRQNHRKESKIIQQTWDAVRAKQVDKDKFVITHEYQYCNPTNITYEPSRSNIVEAMNHSKKVIRKAHKQGNLHLLDQQVEKMIHKSCSKSWMRKSCWGWTRSPTSLHSSIGSSIVQVPRPLSG